MSDNKIAQSLTNLGAGLDRLGEALQEPETTALIVDGTIQRFEFVIEIYWKTLKRLLAAEHIQVATPREALQQAYRAHWLNDEQMWLQMLKDRNETSHIYNEQMARQIYERIRTYFPELQSTYRSLRRRFES